MPQSKLKAPAFGSKCPRFANSHFGSCACRTNYDHATQGKFTLHSNGDSKETAKDEEKISKFKAFKNTWDRELQLEAEAALPQVSLKHSKWKEKKELGRNLGPGTYNIKDFLEESQSKPMSSKGIFDSLVKPRTTYKNTTTPGPGAYGDMDLTSSFKVTTKPPIKNGFMSAVYGRDLPKVGNDVGPGSYEIPHEIDTYVKKKVSFRGPYDVFTGPRDESTLNGYFKHTKKSSYQPGQYDITNAFTDSLKKKKNYGKFIFSGRTDTTPKFITPGPAHYFPKTPDSYFSSKPQPKKQAPFNTTAVRKTGTESTNPVTAFVHFYDIDKTYKIKRDGNTSSFKPCGRFIHGDREKMLNERMK